MRRRGAGTSAAPILALFGLIDQRVPVSRRLPPSRDDLLRVRDRTLAGLAPVQPLIFPVLVVVTGCAAATAGDQERIGSWGLVQALPGSTSSASPCSPSPSSWSCSVVVAGSDRSCSRSTSSVSSSCSTGSPGSWSRSRGSRRRGCTRATRSRSWSATSRPAASTPASPGRGSSARPRPSPVPLVWTAPSRCCAGRRSSWCCSTCHRCSSSAGSSPARSPRRGSGSGCSCWSTGSDRTTSRRRPWGSPST